METYTHPICTHNQEICLKGSLTSTFQSTHRMHLHHLMYCTLLSLYRVQPVAAGCIIGWDTALPLMQYTGALTSTLVLISPTSEEG